MLKQSLNLTKPLEKSKHEQCVNINNYKYQCFSTDIFFYYESKYRTKNKTECGFVVCKLFIDYRMEILVLRYYSS